LAIFLQGLCAILIALSGRYEQILNYVVSVDFIFFGATALCIFIFRRRMKATTVNLSETDNVNARITKVPGHPVTTAVFVAVCWVVVINTVYRYPENTLIGLAILLAGIPAFFLWRWSNSK
jgi:APA family basic amino acid/polyamine antiporter